MAGDPGVPALGGPLGPPADQGDLTTLGGSPTEAYAPKKVIFRHDDLPGQIREALTKLRSDFERITDMARREYVKKCLKNHELFRGNAWNWFDYTTGTWRSYNSAQGGVSNSPASMNQTQSLYTLNIFQGFALSIISLLSGNKMTIKWWPRNSHKAEDIEAAKKHDAVTQWFQTTERAHSQLVKAIYHLWCDGTFGSYVRTVTDADRFGWMDEPIIETQVRPVGPPLFQCVVCGNQGPDAGNCQQCGAPLPMTPDVPAPTAPVPVVTGTRKIPRSRTVRDVVGGLELKLPPTAEDLYDFPYLIRSRELHKSQVRATYTDIADQIGNYEGSEGTEGASSILEKRARLQATMGTSIDNRSLPINQQEYVTFTEVWFRRSAFYNLDDKKTRDTLLALFPDGAYVAFANDVVCEARSEKMEDHWRICHALPGKGQVREPIGGALVQVQEIVNDLLNIIRDTIEYTLPATFVDQQVLDVRKWARSQVMAGAVYNVTPKGNRPIGEGFFQTQPGTVPPIAITFFNDLRTNIAQFASGAFPASYGAGSPGNNTAQGIEIERNAALGRLSLFLRALTEHYAQFAPLVVLDFKENALEPVTVVHRDMAGEFKTDVLRPEDLDVGEAQTIPELNEDYPTTWPQRQALLLQMFANPLFQGTLAQLSNTENIRRTLGHDLNVPGEDAYHLQFKIIQQLLAEQPVPSQVPITDPMTGQPVIDPMTGQPAVQEGPPQPSVMPNPLEDQASMLQACLDFYYSADGQQAKMQNPAGWENFLLHAQMRQMALMPPPPPPGPDGQAPVAEGASNGNQGEAPADQAGGSPGPM